MISSYVQYPHTFGGCFEFYSLMCFACNRIRYFSFSVQCTISAYFRGVLNFILYCVVPVE